MIEAINENHIRLALVLMATVALPKAIEHDHYVAVLVWLAVLAF